MNFGVMHSQKPICPHTQDWPSTSEFLRVRSFNLSAYRLRKKPLLRLTYPNRLSDNVVNSNKENRFDFLTVLFYRS